ncbi:MAG: type II toxin-antitoxin system YafQ family toxin [Prolixibacteraceae bacterium]
MYSIEFTGQYLRDLKLARKRNLDEQKLNTIVRILISGNPLPTQYRNHSLSGNFTGCYECHITPDWLLIYSKNTSIKLITLLRTGTHSDLFR